LKLLQGGGNAAIIGLVLIAIRVANRFLTALEKIATQHAEDHAEVVATQEAIKRAIVAGNPKAERVFTDEEMRRAGRA
jgi:hypothetical protein